MNKHRETINAIDKEITELLVKRFNAAKHIGDYKREHRLQIEDLKREEEILSVLKYSLRDEETASYIVNIFREIFTQSKAYQKNNY